MYHSLTDSENMDPASTGLATIRSVQKLLALIAALNLTAHRFPSSSIVKDGSKFDYIIVGGGTAGCIVASRLTENPNVTVALIEAGGDPPIESVLPGLFTIMPASDNDFNFPTVPDNYTAQYLQGKAVRLTAGKFLGGTSSLQHMLHVRGNSRDYQRWATAANDSSWDYKSLLPYFIKSEKMEDSEILKSDYSSYHGTNGSLAMSREPSDENINIMKSFEEMGIKYLDVNADQPLGVTESLFVISGGERQSTAQSYLGPAKNRKNLFVFKHTTVTKLLFDDSKKAYGVKALTKNNKTVIINAEKEVILAAGVVKTTQLMLLSGIGPKSHLEEWDIPVIADLPVGETLQDQVGATVAYKLQSSQEPSGLPNIFEFPSPLTMTFKTFDSESPYPDYQSINLLYPHDFVGFFSICSNAFKYNNDICNQMYYANQGHGMMYSVVYILQPKSNGQIKLRSTDPLDYPSIYTGYFSNTTDLDNLASYLLDFAAVVNTTYFKRIGAELVDLDLKDCRGLDKNSWDYWRCYGLSMSVSLWHSCGTCPMGTVLDSKLNVKGVQGLRVVDAAGIPSVNSGKLMAAVVVFAEKAADLIKNDMNS